jgi:hypothetical protein
MDEVNKARQKADVATKDPAPGKQKQPDFLDFSAPIYPGDTNGAKRASQNNLPAESGTTGPKSDTTGAQDKGDGKTTIDTPTAPGSPAKPTELTTGTEADPKATAKAVTEGTEGTDKSQPESKTPAQKETEGSSQGKPATAADKGEGANNPKESPSRVDRGAESPAKTPGNETPVGGTASENASKQQGISNGKDKGPEVEGKTPANTPVEDTNKAQKGGEAAGGGSATGEVSQKTGAGHAQRKGGAVGGTNSGAGDKSEQSGEANLAQAINPDSNNPADDLKAPSTPGRVSYDLSGNKTTKWGNGAVQVENEAKKTRGLKIPDGLGGYREQHWGPNAADNSKMNRTIEKIGGSDAFRNEVGKAYGEIPHGVRKMLDNNNFSLVTADKYTDAEVHEKDRRPEGYDKGDTGANKPAGFNFRWNVATIAEHPDSDRQGTVNGVVKHEVGHAFDLALKGYSDRDEFSAAYKRDLAKIGPEDRKTLDYYIQPKDGNGQIETFAELFCKQVGGQNDPIELEKYFPESAALVKKKIKEAQ